MLFRSALSNLVDQATLLRTLGAQLELLLPSQSGRVLAEVSTFVKHRAVIGWVLLGTMIFFSSLAFSVLEDAMAAIFSHRTDRRRRHVFISALLPYVYVVCLCLGFLVVSLATTGLQALSGESLHLLGRTWSLASVSGGLLQVLGVGGEVLMLTSIYVVMPVGRPRLRHALIGGVTAALGWEVVRRVVVWYFANLFHAGVLYGSLTTAKIGRAHV